MRIRYGKRKKSLILAALVMALLFVSVSVVSVYAAAPANPRVTTSRVTWDCVYFGNYNGKQIKWRVLKVDGNEMFLLADDSVEEKVFDLNTVMWKDCSLRTWLNGDFYNSAFSSSEQAAIIETSVDNTGTGMYADLTGAEDTTDRIFVLSYSEYSNANYGFPLKSSFTRCIGHRNTTTCRSWMRSTGETSGGIMVLMDLLNGSKWEGQFTVGSPQEEGLVIPALKIKRDSGLWTSAGTVAIDSNGNINSKSDSSLPNTDSTQDQKLKLLFGILFAISIVGAKVSLYLRKQ